ncbi:MAG: VENN motif pre-toxin domain-containing protein [Proteus hauseri]|nr:VENN motif pre-toxin domain-containing protein [Proteus hauseri]
MKQRQLLNRHLYIEGAVTSAQTGKNAVENNFLTKVALEGCALTAPCRGFVAKKVLEYGVKAGITAIVAKEIANNISSDDLDHLITLNMMGNDEITNRYLDYLSGKYATSVQSPDISSQLPGYPIPTPLPPLPGTPIPEQDKDDGKLITPIIEPTDQRPNHQVMMMGSVI